MRYLPLDARDREAMLSRIGVPDIEALFADIPAAKRIQGLLEMPLAKSEMAVERAMMTIANLDTIWVTANVPEKDISYVFTGQTVNVTFASYPDKVFSGKVLFISDVIEPDTRRNKVRIAFDNPDKIMKPNMFANATFVAPPEMRIMVPNSALLMTNDKTSVFVEVQDWAFERRDVEIAYQEGTATAIKSGLQPSQRVVVKGGVRLND